MLQALPAPSPSVWSHVYEIVAVALLLGLQTVWQRRTGSKSFDAKLTALGNDFRTVVNAQRDMTATDFAEVRSGISALGNRIELWTEKTTSLGKSVDGLLDRERARLEVDAQPTRRRRRS